MSTNAEQRLQQQCDELLVRLSAMTQRAEAVLADVNEIELEDLLNSGGIKSALNKAYADRDEYKNRADYVQRIAEDNLQCATEWKQRAEAAEAKSKALPEGWQLVPKIPTQAMVQDGRAQYYHTPESHWTAMLAAAPKPGGLNE